MKTWRTLRYLLFVLVVASCWWLESIAASDQVTAERPNVVFIISDDHAWHDHGFLGNDRVRTPHIDALASKSARYVNGYVPSSVCRPSLATLLNGLYPHQHGIHFNHPPPGFRALGQMPSVAAYDRARQAAVNVFRQSPTLPGILSGHGYVSFQAGKHWEGTYSDAGFTEGMTKNQPCFDQPWNRKLPNGQWAAHGNGDFGLVIGRRTMKPVFDFVDRNKRRPFLLWYAPVLPHEPHNAPENYRSMANNAGVPEHVLGYYANIAWFDHTVGQLLEHFERHDLTRNTLFVYVADNGWSNAPESIKQDRRSKRSPFENGIRTPILLRWEGVTEPGTHKGLVSSVDIVPTVLAALGVDRKGAKTLPGIDLLPSAKGTEALDPERPVYGEIYPGDASTLGKPERDVAYRWVRHKHLKLIVPHAQADGKVWNNYLTETTLYDLSADPRETTNLARRPNRAADVRRLLAMLNAWWNPDFTSE